MEIINSKSVIIYYPPEDINNKCIYILEFTENQIHLYRQFQPNEYLRHCYMNYDEYYGRIRILENVFITSIQQAEDIIQMLWGTHIDIIKSFIYDEIFCNKRNIN